MASHGTRRAPIVPHGFAVIIALVALVCGSLTVNAAEDEPQVRLSIKPVNAGGSYFALTMTPGETRQLAVELGNHGQQPIRARTFAADVYTIPNGGFGAELDGDTPSGPTLWLDYDAETFDLEPDMANVRPFIVSVPADTKPGDYITGLVIQNAVATQGSGDGVTLKQFNRQALAVAITVPGDRVAKLGIGGVTYRDAGLGSVITFDVSNAGNTHLKPAGEFVLYDASDTEIVRQAVTMDTFYARTATVVEIAFSERLAEGEYRATLSLTDPTYDASASTPEPLGFIVPKAIETLRVPAPGTPAAATIQPVEPPAPSGQPWVPIAIGVVAVLALVGLGFSGYAFVASRGARRGVEDRTTTQPDLIAQRVATVAAPAAVDVKPAVVRQLVPPGHVATSRPKSQPSLRPIQRG